MNKPGKPAFIEPGPDEISKDPKTGKTISRKRNFVLGAGAMAAGSAANDLLDQADIPEIILDQNNDGTGDTVLTDVNEDGIYELPVEDAFETAPEENAVQQSWNPNTAPMASPGNINDNMSFTEAFSAAREELGAGGVFEWHGQFYNTFYAEELDDHNQPLVEYEVTEHHDLDPSDYSDPGPVDENTPELGNQGANEDAMPDLLVADFDMDGNADAVYIDLNQDGSADGVYTDLNQDGEIAEDELLFIHDPESLENPGSASDGSMMSIDSNADGNDDMLIADLDGDQVADVAGIDGNMDMQIEESEMIILNPEAMENTDFGPSEIEYSGETSADIPEDVPDEVLDEMTDDLASLEDNFDEINNWS